MLQAKDIMSQNVAVIQGSATVAEAIQLMKYKQLWALLVEGDTCEPNLGIVTKDDFIYKVAACGRNPGSMRVEEIMTKPCMTVQPEMDVKDVARLFSHTPAFCAPVIGDRPIGIISASDIKAMLCVEQSGHMVPDSELATRT